MDEFFDFMDRERQSNPYPKYLFRAHVHGLRYPRVWDDTAGAFRDSFAANYDLSMQHRGIWSLETPVNYLQTPDRLLSELLLQLESYEDAYSYIKSYKDTRLVSLSSKFCWTVQRLCRIGGSAEGHQRPGLAIFDTAKITRPGSLLFRVSDLLAYLDQSPWQASIDIPEKLRNWALNCNEHVCWSVLPKAALIAFVPLSVLREDSSSSTPFLLPEFKASKNLGEFRFGKNRVSVSLTQEELHGRISRFLAAILRCVTPQYDIEQLDATELRNWFDYIYLPDFGYTNRHWDEAEMLNVIKTQLRLAADRRRQDNVGISEDSEEEDIGTSLATLSIQ